MTQEEYINERLEGQIKWYSKKGTYNKKCYQFLKGSEIILAATTPFLIAFMKESFTLQIIAGIMSIVIGIVAALLIAFKFHEKWIKYRTTCEDLKREKYLFVTKSGPYATQQNVSMFVEKVEFILAKENSDWSQIVISNDHKDSKEGEEEEGA